MSIEEKNKNFLWDIKEEENLIYGDGSTSKEKMEENKKYKEKKLNEIETVKTNKEKQ